MPVRTFDQAPLSLRCGGGREGETASGAAAVLVILNGDTSVRMAALKGGLRAAAKVKSPKERRVPGAQKGRCGPRAKEAGIPGGRDARWPRRHSLSSLCPKP
jgi:hypothetical protein